MLKLTGIGNVIMRNPNLGDRLALDNNMVIAKTLNGTVKTYKGTKPTFYTASFTSELNTAATINAMLAFMIANAGLQVNLESDNSGSVLNSLAGYITTPINDIETARDDSCSYTISFDFLYKIATASHMYPDDCP